jgi:hypothetical protein
MAHNWLMLCRLTSAAMQQRQQQQQQQQCPPWAVTPVKWRQHTLQLV